MYIDNPTLLDLLIYKLIIVNLIKYKNYNFYNYLLCLIEEDYYFKHTDYFKTINNKIKKYLQNNMNINDDKENNEINYKEFADIINIFSKFSMKYLK